MFLFYDVFGSCFTTLAVILVSELKKNYTIVVSPLNVYYTRDYCIAIILITLVSCYGFDIIYVNETHAIALRMQFVPYLCWLVNWFHAELSPKEYWRGPGSQEVGKRETVPNATLSPPQ